MDKGEGREKRKRIKEHIENFPESHIDKHYTEDAVNYLHRNPSLTPGLFCLGSPTYSTNYRHFEIKNWLAELTEILGIKVELKAEEENKQYLEDKKEEINIEQNLSKRFGKK